MKTIAVAGEFREGKTPKKIREEGFVPAVIYGKKITSVSIAVDKKIFGKIFSQAGESTIFHIQTSDKKGFDVLVRDIEYHPLSGEMMHIDFYAVSMNEAVETWVEFEFIGESNAVKEEGGIFVTGLNGIDIKALPSNLPSSIMVDISKLKTFDDFIHVGELSVPEGVEILTAPDSIVASVSRPRTEEEENLSSDVDVTKVEVAEKGKKEEIVE